MSASTAIQQTAFLSLLRRLVDACPPAWLTGGLSIVAFHAMALLRLYQFPWTAAGALFGAGLGAITGIALTWLLRPSFSEE